ncbi:hypothetical protein PENTCL1PPCAC_13329, partial [Pristionchus entomophagus]
MRHHSWTETEGNQESPSLPPIGYFPSQRRMFWRRFPLRFTRLGRRRTSHSSCTNRTLKWSEIMVSIYIVDQEGQLERVLQKPSEKEMEEEEAIGAPSPDPWCFTDSAYFISSKITHRLLEFVAPNCPIETKVCAYGDFMRSLGKKTKKEPEAIDFTGLDQMDIKTRHNLHIWRLCLDACFKGAKIQLLGCGFDSFFHFGSIAECRQHFHNLMKDRRDIPFIPLHSTWEYKVGQESIVEYSNLPPNPYTVIGNLSIVSNCYVGRKKNLQTINIPDNVVVYNTPVVRNNRKGWVTVVIETEDNVKKSHELGHVLWSGTKLKDYECTSLWNAPLFTMTHGAEKSLLQSLRKYQHRETDPEILKCCGWSMADVVRYVDADKLVQYMRQRRKLWWRYG